jgi:hypothetical protein
MAEHRARDREERHGESALRPMTDGPAATMTARHTPQPPEERGADVVQAVERVAHQDDAERGEHLDRDPATTSAASGDIAHGSLLPEGLDEPQVGDRPDERHDGEHEGEVAERLTVRALGDQEQGQDRVDGRRLDAMRPSGAGSRTQTTVSGTSAATSTAAAQSQPFTGGAAGVARAGSPVGTSSWTSSTRRSASMPITSVFGARDPSAWVKTRWAVASGSSPTAAYGTSTIAPCSSARRIPRRQSATRAAEVGDRPPQRPGRVPHPRRPGAQQHAPLAADDHRAGRRDRRRDRAGDELGRRDRVDQREPQRGQQRPPDQARRAPRRVRGRSRDEGVAPMRPWATRAVPSYRGAASPDRDESVPGRTGARSSGARPGTTVTVRGPRGFRFPHRGLVYDGAGHGIRHRLPTPATGAAEARRDPRADAAALADIGPRPALPRGRGGA